jgi:transcription factor SPT20
MITDEYILKKHGGKPPSLIVHLHPNHFRFDQQDGIFPYRSPMKVFLDHCKSRTIPQDLLPELTEGGVSFYDGCLIVQIHDHKSVAQSKDVTRPTSASDTTTPFSIHNYNQYITPSPYVPYPKQHLHGTGDASGSPEISKAPGVDGQDKENMPAPALTEGQKSKLPPKAKVRTIVLHPTPQSLQMDLMIKATTSKSSTDAKSADGSSMVPPPTPITAVPPTPGVSAVPPPAKRQKRERMELDGTDIYAAEAQILLATAPPLHLETAKNAEETIALLSQMADESHSEPPPKPKSRKRTVAERAADEALAADHEKYMLTFDERLSSNVGGSQGGVEGADGNGQSGGAAFEPRFERFKIIEEIKREHAEKREQEKIRQAEQERKLAIQRQQQQAEQAQLLQQRQAQEQQQEKLRREEAARQARQQQENQRRLAQQQQQQQQAAQMQAAAAHSPTTMQHQMSQPSHGHPTPNAMPTSLPGHRFPQQVSQAAVSSPIVRQNTPHAMSSPMVANVPMQHTSSGMGGSPPRPSSIVQNPAMSAPMAVSMSARNSQQSHGTPRMPSATPQMAHGTPISRAMATPRMSQASSPPTMMAQNPQVTQAMLMGNQNMQNPMYAAQIAAAQQRQRIAQQQQMAALQSGMINGQNPQQMQANLQQLQQQATMRQQMMNMQQNGGGMFNSPQAQAQVQLAQRYQQQLNMQGQMGGQQMGGQQGFMNGNPNGMSQQQQMAAMQQMQQMKQMQQMQQQPHGQNPALMAQQRSLQQQLVHRQQQIYNANIGNLAQQYGNSIQNIPPEVHENFRRQCIEKARSLMQQQMQQQMQMRNQQAQAQLMQQQLQQGMPNGMVQGM